NGSGGLVNPRLQKELVRVQSIYEAKSRAGKRSAEVRWGSRAINTGDSSGGNTTENSAISETVTPRPDQNQTSALPTPPDSANPSSSESAERAGARDGGGSGDPKKPDGKIRLRDGKWVGMTQEQELYLQGVFPGIAILDHIDRAAAWLQANDKDRLALEPTGKYHPFLVNWLLRETRPKPGNEGRPH